MILMVQTVSEIFCTSLHALSQHGMVPSYNMKATGKKERFARILHIPPLDFIKYKDLEVTANP